MGKKWIWLYFLVVIVSCSDPYVQKNKDYPRINFPVHSYVSFDSGYCPLTFEYPSYAVIHRKELFFNKEPEHPCWINIEYPQFNATLYVSYKDLGTYRLYDLMEDAYKLTMKHSQKADYIEPLEIATDNNVYGLVYDVGGDAASAIQFFATDTVEHYLRGALYFNERPNRDSMAPVINFLYEDIQHLLGSLKWRSTE